MSEDEEWEKRRDTYDFVRGVVAVQVNTDDVHRGIGRRRGDDDLLGTTLQMGAGPISQEQKRIKRAFSIAFFFPSSPTRSRWK